MKTILLTLTLLVCAASPSLAYLDPGTGSMILQALAAGVIAAGLFWRRIISFVRGLFNKNSAD